MEVHKPGVLVLYAAWKRKGNDIFRLYMSQDVESVDGIRVGVEDNLEDMVEEVVGKFKKEVIKDWQPKKRLKLRDILETKIKLLELYFIPLSSNPALENTEMEEIERSVYLYKFWINDKNKEKESMFNPTEEYFLVKGAVRLERKEEDLWRILLQ